MTRLAYKEKIYELLEYRSNDTAIKTFPCHADFDNIMPELRIQLLAKNIDTYIKDIPQTATFEDTTSYTENFKTIERIYRTLEDSMQTYHYTADQLLDSVQSLSKGEISNYLFNLLKQTKCHVANPFPDFLLYKDCSFYNKNVTCQIVVENPTVREKVGKIIPVPYKGYEIANLEHAYLNLTSKKLIHLTCKHNQLLMYNCHKKSDSLTPCLTALTNNQFSKILQECTFKFSSLQTPVLTTNGLLVPYSKNISVYIMKNASNPENLTKWDIFRDTQSPVLINSMYNMSLYDDIFQYMYKQFNSVSNIIFTAYTNAELDEMTEYVETIFPLTNENILIISQIGLSVFVFLLGSLSCVYCIKFRSQSRLLSYFKTKSSPPIYKTKRLRKFATPAGRVQKRGDSLFARPHQDN